MNAEKTVSILKIVSDPAKVRIIAFLLKFSDGICVNEISQKIGISYSATSHQLAKLEARDVVISYRDRQMICYKMKDGAVANDVRRIIGLFDRNLYRPVRRIRF